MVENNSGKDVALAEQHADQKLKANPILISIHHETKDTIVPPLIPTLSRPAFSTLKPLQTPNVKMSPRDNFHSKSMIPSIANRTPVPGQRSKVAETIHVDEPIERMASLHKLHGTQASRLRGRNASASVDSQLQIKIRQDMDSIFDRDDSVTTQVLKSKRFHQKWSTSKQSVSSLHDVLQNRGCRSLTRQQLAKFSNSRLQQKLPPLQASASLAAKDTAAAHGRFRGGSPSARPSQRILDNLSENMDDAPYFGEESINNLTVNDRQINQNAYSSRMSNMDAQSSMYHMELLEDRREELQNIIKKRKQRAALVTEEKKIFIEEKPKVGAFNVLLQPHNGALFPQITPRRQRPPIKTGGPDSQMDDTHTETLLSPQNMSKLIKFEQGVDAEIAKSERAPGTLNDSNDEKRVVRLKKDVSVANRPKLTLSKVETRPFNEPDLETLKRANRKGNQAYAKAGFETQEKNVKIIQKRLIQKHPQPQQKAASNKDLEAELDSPALTKQHQAIGKAMNTGTASEEFKFMTEKFVNQQMKVEKKKSVITSGKKANKGDPQSPRLPQSKLSKVSSRGLEELSLSDSESRVSTPDAATVSPTFKMIQGIIDPQSALRIQKMIKKTKQKEKTKKIDYMAQLEQKKEEEELEKQRKIKLKELEQMDQPDEFDRGQRENFNSELDIYSEIDSNPQAYGNTARKRNSKAQPAIMAMKAIPAEDSEEERGSGSGSNKEDGEEEGEDEYEEEQAEESDHRDSALNERNKIKKDIKLREQNKKEEVELCGPHLTKKIDDFIQAINVKAGLSDQQFSPDATNLNQTTARQQQHMLDTGNTSLFQLEKTKNDDQGVFEKAMDKYVSEFRGQQAFFQLCKTANDSKFTDPNLNNPKMEYFNQCTKANSVAKGILSKVQEKQLLLRDLKLNQGDALGLHEILLNHPNIINKLYLDSNGLDGEKLAAIIEGFSFQSQTHNLSIQSNEINEECVEHIGNLLKRKIPDNLQELHLIHTRSNFQCIEDLVRGMKQRNYLRKLSLIEVGLNDTSVEILCDIVRTQKTLVSLDISWNHLRPQQMKPLLYVFSKNRRLIDLNLSWNNIMEIRPDDNLDFESHVTEVHQMLGKLLKQSKTLQHLDLTGTGLSSGVIYEMGNILRRARSILCIHLSGNPGLNQENMEYLSTRIKCRKNEDIQRYTRIRGVVQNVLKKAGTANNVMGGIQVKVERDTSFSQVHKNDPIGTSINDQLVFQRMLGHKEEQPGSAQWYESSKNAVACKPHYKNECWYDEGHVYSILFWSKGQCYKLNPILSKDKTEKIRYEIDYDFGEQENDDLQYENTNIKYSQMQNQVPFICGSFTGWRYRKMSSLLDFVMQFNEEPFDPFEVAKYQRLIRKRVQSIDKCDEYEKKHIEIIQIEENLKQTYNWRQIFAKSLRFKRPYIMNSNLYYERPSADGTLPEEDLVNQMGDINSDTSDEPESADEQEEQKKIAQIEHEKRKLSSLAPWERELLKEKEREEKKKPPMPVGPDVEKFDKIFILPFFCKPGKHQYMIKYKDVNESSQSHMQKQIKVLERRYRRAKNDQSVSKPFDKVRYRNYKRDLQPECFFYQCEVPKRTEEIIPFSKTMNTNTVQRSFNKEASVFNKWRADSVSSLQNAFNEDIKLWKGYRFIKEEQDKTDTEMVLKKYYQQLKTIFLHVASTSAWPNIGQLDFCEVATKSKFLDQFVNISSVDRSFIAANLKVEGAGAAPSNGLKRFEYLEILVRLANIKYLESKIVSTFAEATEKLLSECLLLHFIPEPWQDWRDKELWTLEINDTLMANMMNLNTIYLSYKTATKAKMDYQDCLDMCIKDSSLNIPDKDILFCFGYCHMTILNEERQWKQYHSLEFVEYLEFICRLAHQKFKHSEPEIAHLPLVNKVEFILDDLLQGFGMTRNEVNIEVEENSESDEDY